MRDGGNPTRLYALSAKNGHILWHRNGGDGEEPDLNGSMAIISNSIYTLISNGKIDYGVAAYNAKNGSLSWKTSTIVDVGPFYGPAITGSILYLIDGYGRLYALSLINGRTIFSVPTYGFPAGLTAANGIAYVACGKPNGSSSSPGSFYAIRSGRQIWHVPTRGFPMANLVIAGDLIYFMTYEGILSALRTDTGREVWNFQAGSPSERYPNRNLSPGNWVTDGKVYVNDPQSRVYALRAADGTEIWHTPFGQQVILAIGEDAVYVSDKNGEIRALRIKDGGTIWHLETGNPNPIVTPAGNGVVYVGTNNLYAIRARDGKKIWSFPVSVKSLTTAPGVIYAGADVRLYAVLT